MKRRYRRSEELGERENAMVVCVCVRERARCECERERGYRPFSFYPWKPLEDSLSLPFVAMDEQLDIFY
jgi:hypothetical protein